MPFGLRSFTEQNAKNFQAFKEWHYQELDLRTMHTFVKADYITPESPAKEIIIYQKPGTATDMSTPEDGDADLYTLFFNDTLTDATILTDDVDIAATDGSFSVDSDATDYLSVGDVILMSNTAGGEIIKLTGVGATLLASSYRAAGTFAGTVRSAHANNEKIYVTGDSSLYSQDKAVYPIIYLMGGSSGDLPFKMSGVSITSLYINNSDAESDDADDYLSVLSFH